MISNVTFSLKPLIYWIFILSVTLHCGKEHNNTLIEQDLIVNNQSGKFSELQCFFHFNQTVEDYLVNRLSQSEITEFWNCIDSAIYLFGKYVRGKNEDRYEISEIMEFLSIYSDINWSPQTWDAVWEVTRSLFLSGGEGKGASYVTKKDLSQLRTKAIVLLEAISIDLSPHASTLATLVIPKSLSSYPSVQQRKSAFLALDQTSDLLGQWVQKNSGFLDLSILKNKLTSTKNLSDFETDLILWIDLFSTAKSMLIGGESRNIEKSEWTSFFNLFSRVIEVYSYSQLASINKNFYHQPKELDQLDATIQKVYQSFSQALSRRKSNSIPNNEFYELFDKIKFLDLIPSSLSPTNDNFPLLWDTLTNKILKSFVKDAFHVSHLELLKTEINDWLQTQALINDNAINQNLNCASLSGNENEITNIVACTSWPLRNNSQGLLYMSQDLLNSKWTVKDLSSLNWKRSLIRQLIKTYSNNQDLGIGLNVNQLGDAYNDLQPLLIALGLVDKDNTSFHKEVFFLARMLALPFSKLASKSQNLNQREGVVFLHHLLSETRRTQLLVSQLDSCVAPDSTGTFLHSCYWDVFQAQFPHIFQSMPDLVHYMENLDSQEWSELTENLSTLVGVLPESAFTQEHIVKMFTFINFIEAIILKYDKNLDQVINSKEIQVFISTFIPSIQPIAPSFEVLGSSDSLVHTLTFLFKKGEIPGITTLDNEIFTQFDEWIEQPLEDLQLSVERSHWFRGFSILSTFFL